MGEVLSVFKGQTFQQPGANCSKSDYHITWGKIGYIHINNEISLFHQICDDDIIRAYKADGERDTFWKDDVNRL